MDIDIDLKQGLSRADTRPERPRIANIQTSQTHQTPWTTPPGDNTKMQWPGSTATVGGLGSTRESGSSRPATDRALTQWPDGRWRRQRQPRTPSRTPNPPTTSSPTDAPNSGVAPMADELPWPAASAWPVFPPCVCNQLFNIPLHAARRAIAAVLGFLEHARISRPRPSPAEVGSLVRRSATNIKDRQRKTPPHPKKMTNQGRKDMKTTLPRRPRPKPLPVYTSISSPDKDSSQTLSPALSSTCSPTPES